MLDGSHQSAELVSEEDLSLEVLSGLVSLQNFDFSEGLDVVLLKDLGLPGGSS